MSLKYFKYTSIYFSCIFNSFLMDCFPSFQTGSAFSHLKTKQNEDKPKTFHYPYISPMLLPYFSIPSIAKYSQKSIYVRCFYFITF